MTNGSGKHIIEIAKLRKAYRVGDVTVEALRGVDLDIDEGDFLAISGPSGSGKSTLFNVLGGLTPATSGSVRIAGVDMATMSETQLTDLRKTKIGFVFQKYNLLPTLTAGDNIAIACHIAKVPFTIDGQFREVLELLGIEKRLDHKPRAMSGGEQQRVAIARALVNHPAILLADEPTGNLDSENSDAVLELLRDLNQRTGQTILMITHDHDAALHANRIVKMKDGRIVP